MEVKPTPNEFWPMQFEVSTAWTASFSPKPTEFQTVVTKPEFNTVVVTPQCEPRPVQLKVEAQGSTCVWGAVHRVSGHEKVVRYIFYILSRLLEQTCLREGSANRSYVRENQPARRMASH